MAQTGKSKLAAKLGARANTVINQHRNDEVNYGRRNLPGGISGVARVTKLYVDEYKSGAQKGKLYFRGEGVVVEISTPGFAEFVGQFTSIMEPLCDTKNSKQETVTQDDHLVRVMNQLKKLDPQAMEGTTVENMEEVMASMANSGIHFRFDTTTSEPPPGSKFKARVFENWYGSKDLENYVPPGVEKATTKDNTATAPAAATTAPPARRNPPPTKTAPAPEPEPEEPLSEEALAEEGAEGDDGLDQLARDADDDTSVHKDDAQTELDRIADELQIDRALREQVSSWSEVVSMIREAQGAAAEPEPEPAPAPAQAQTAAPIGGVPVVGKTYKYKPKGKPKAIGMECVSVNKLKKLVNLKSNDDNKEHKDVPWTALSL